MTLPNPKCAPTPNGSSARCRKSLATITRPSLLLALEVALELHELVLQLPRLLLAEVLLLVVLKFLLYVLDGLLDVLRLHGLGLLDIDLVARLVIDLIWALLRLNLPIKLDLTLF